MNFHRKSPPIFQFTTLAVLIGVGFPSQADAAAEPKLPEKAHAILEQHCFKCHSHAENKSKGGLLMDSIEALLEGGETGPALVAGKPDESLFIKAIRYDDEDLKMPPKGEKLSPADVATLVEWVKAGAPWTAKKGGEAAGANRRKPGKLTDEDRKWWAFQPVQKVQAPAVDAKDTAIRNDVDRFVLASLENAELTPAPEASRTALIRRVTLDLTGVPPTPEEVATFVADTAPDAYEKLVERLLSSPRYGERMSRHWLDLVRYSDGDGYRADDYRPHAWRYRDYVIRAFNDDKPYDRFVSEQLAGDELFPESPDALIATGYLRHGIYEWNARDVRGQWDYILNDLTDTTGDVFLGLGIQCARCHDHKFDPILQRDYFRLRAFFAAYQPGDVVAVTAEEKTAHAAKMKVWEEKTAAIREEIAKLEKPYLDRAEKAAVARFPDDIQAMILKPAASREPLETQLAALAWRQVEYDWERVDRSFKGPDKERILTLRRELATHEKDKPAPLPVAFAAADVGPKAAPVHIPKKQALGDIEPGFLTLLDPSPAPVKPLPHSTGRRSALARWLIAPENPLTSRVIVNRVWQQHFGRGLAANASDFGMLGEKPTHPELLDWLAGWFVREGWSLKKIHRLVVTSATYRQSSHHPSPEAGMLSDPENKLLWRNTPRRLEAEQIRDSLFAVSGELSTAAGGPGKPADQPVRTIYTRFMRNTRDQLADVFDAPMWFTSAASRDTTTTPVQSLLLANSAILRTRGQAFAERLQSIAPGDSVAQVKAAYQLAFGREAKEDEVGRATAFLSRQQSLADQKLLASGQAAFIPEKVPYRDGQAALIEPAGEQRMFRVNGSTSMSIDGAFTIEAFVVPRSVSDAADLRTIAAKWNGNTSGAGWALGITGQKSRRKPLTIAMQLIGKNREGAVTEYPVFADIGVQMNKPYFIAAAVTPATEAAAGSVFFAVKDLSNDDEPLLTATVEHPMMGGWANKTPMTIAARSAANPNSFHGVIDDVRLSNAALPAAKMLYISESIAETTVGYWRFEAKPDVFADSSNHGYTLERPANDVSQNLTPYQAALTDFCQALFNSSEFLYTE
jgi:mono/diheme cytochrome c family protein